MNFDRYNKRELIRLSGINKTRLKDFPLWCGQEQAFEFVHYAVSTSLQRQQR